MIHGMKDDIVNMMKVKKVIDLGLDDGQTNIDQSRVSFTSSVVDVQKNLTPLLYENRMLMLTCEMCSVILDTVVREPKQT